MREIADRGDAHMHRATCSHGCAGSHCCGPNHRHIDPARVPWRLIASMPATRSDVTRASLLLRSGEVVADVLLARAVISETFELLHIAGPGGRVVAAQEVALVCVDIGKLSKESTEAQTFIDRTGMVFQRWGVIDYRGNFN